MRVGDKMLSVNGEMCHRWVETSRLCVAGHLHPRPSEVAADLRYPGILVALVKPALGRAMALALVEASRPLLSAHRCTGPEQTASILREAEGAPRLELSPEP